MHRNDFPSDFVWGAATAAYQIEGAIDEGGRGPSIWDTFAARPGAIADGSTGAVADDHYHRVDEDVALMADLGLDAYRFSIAWPRIQPDGTGDPLRSGVDFYRRLCERLLAAGITPWATLYHWDLPQALEERGGWLDRDTAHRFADYSAHIAAALADLVPNWITLNEPWCSAFLGYASGRHAPGRTVGARAAQAAHHLLLGHGQSMAAIRGTVPEANVGITLNLYPVQAGGTSEADLDAVRRVDGLGNRLFLDPVLCGHYPADVLADLGQQEWFEAHATAKDLQLISAPLDFLGVNYYSRHVVTAGGPGPDADEYPGSEHVRLDHTSGPRTQMGWEVHPHGLVEVLEMAHRRSPGLAMHVTENGAAYADEVGGDGSVHDPERTAYLVDHVAACRLAVERGLPLRGYFAWSLMDNFEWGWGYSRRFGLVHVDYDSQRRTPKSSGRWYAGFLGGRLGSTG